MPSLDVLVSLLLLAAVGGAPVPPSPGSAIRVGGTAEAEVERLVARSGDVEWRAGRCRIDTPLPEGYAPPTPPGALEIKSYPAIRRAVVGSADGAGSRSEAFWPLFRHIQDRGIAMTSPVEMDLHGLRPGAANAGDSPMTGWSMAFLYRRAEQGPTGQAGSVQVSDTAPITVLAAGFRGPYEGAQVGEAFDALGEWLAAHPEWEVAGDARALNYNGPFTRAANKWGEVQVPVRPRSSTGS